MRRSIGPGILAAALLLGPAPAAGAGTPAATCAGLAATVVGTVGDDTLTATPGPDVIVGRGGNDTIEAGGGNDVICAGYGDDVVYAGDGDDAAWGEEGADVLRGGAGADRLYGGPGGDGLVGGDGDDLIEGGRGADGLEGNIGDDILLGGEGDDRIGGGAGSDLIHGHDGDDRLIGLDGDDRLAGDAGDDYLDRGSGRDTVDGGAGIDDCGSPGGPHCEVAPFGPGDTGQGVAHLQASLAAALFYRGTVDGAYGEHTEFAVVAFHKAVGRERTADWSYGDWAALAGFSPTVPSRPSEPDRIEVDVTRQILTLVEDGAVTAIVPVSTASGAPYVNRYGQVVYSHTPRGDFHLNRHAVGWSCSYIGCIYRPWFFTPAYAIHGYPRVPPWPASHGCVRVPVWESDWLEGHLYLDMPLHIWDLPPAG